MAQVGSVEYVIKIDDKGSAVVKKVEKNVKSSMKGMQSASARATATMSRGWAKAKMAMSSGWNKIKSAMKGVVVQMLAIYGGYRLIRGLFTFIKESIDLSNIQIAAITKLEQSLKNVGMSVKEVSADFQTYASALQQQTGIGDEVILSQMGMMAAFGGTQEEIKQATQAAIDMSAVVGTDLKATAMLMGRALAGNVSLFSRYGIVIDLAKYKAEGFNAVLAAIVKFQGAAAAQGRTYEGSVIRLSAAWGDYKEQLGFAITKNIAVRASIDVLVRAVTGMTGELKSQEEAYDNLVTRGVFKLIAAGNALAKYMKVWRIIMNSLYTAIYALAIVGAKWAKVLSYIAQGTLTVLNLNEDVRGAFTQFRDEIDGMTTTLKWGMEGAAAEMKGALAVIKDGSPVLNQMKIDVEAMAIAMQNAGEKAVTFKEKVAEAEDETTAAGGAGAKGKDGQDKKEFGLGLGAADWEASQDPDQFWGDFATAQRAYQSPLATWEEHEEAFRRLLEMFAKVDAMVGTTSMKISAAWTAMSAGLKDSVERSNTWLQSMVQAGQDAAQQLQQGFSDTFFNIMQGKFRSLGDLWKNVIKGIVQTFMRALADMLARAIITRLFSFFGMAEGGIMSGGFGPVKKFASGGIATGPTLGVVGEGKYNEAVVPLPDGKTIPVSMKNQQSEPIHLTIYNQVDTVDVVASAAKKNPYVIINPVIADYGNRGPIHRVITRGGK